MNPSAKRPDVRWRLNITRKVLLFLLAAAMLPLVVLGGLAFELSKNIVIAQAEEEYARLAGSLATYVHLYNDQVEDMAANIAGNEEISRALRQADTGTASSYDRLEMRVQMGRLLNSYVRVKGLVSIDLFSVAGEHFHVGETLDVALQRNEAPQSLLREALEAQTPLLWRGVDDNLNVRSAQKKVITASRAIQYFSPLTGRSEPAGVMVISLNDEVMRSFLAGVSLAPGVQIMQVDRAGRIALHSSAQRFGQALPAEMLQLLRANEPVRELVLDGEPTLMNIQADKERGWLYTVLAPRSLLVHKINDLALVTFGLILVGLAAIAALTWYFVRVVVQPIRAVSMGFSQLQQDPHASHDKLALAGRDHEIDELVRGYNNLLDALDAQRLTTEELKRSETERNETETVLSAAMDAIDEAFAVFDADDRLVFCNERFRTTYRGASEVTVPGTNYETILRHIAALGHYVGAPEKFETWIAREIQAHRSGNRFSEVQLMDGRWLRIVERKTAQGQIVGFRVDITALKKAEEAAVAASQAKSSFLATMSHEIRTPMNAILGLLKLLEGTRLTDRQQDYVVKTEGAARSLLGLLNDILDFSKVEAGKMTLDPHPFEVERLLRDLAVILSANVGNKDLEVLFDLDPTLPPMLVGDALRLQQVLINLGGNAIKFTPAGEVVLRIQAGERTHVEGQDHVDVRFELKDSGIGIAPENQEHIFSGFSQAEASTTRRFGGTGLGLAICQRLVGLMGGHLELHSAVGQGSTFSFQLRMPVSNSKATETVGPSAAPAGKVLLVDDNAMARGVVERCLQTWNWPADIAASCEEGLTLTHHSLGAEPRGYGLYLVDWHMQELDGWHFVRELRALEAKHQLPRARVVMMTGHGREMLSNRTALEQGMLDGLLVKPFTSAMLRDAATGDASSGARLRQTLRAGSSKRRLEGLRLLVVEDNLINQQVAEELLNREGALVSLAANGQQGVDAVAHATVPFDAVLMDIQMPIMDGYQATRTIRQGLGRTELPIVAMTANAMDSDRLAAMEAGMNAHVGKPFDLNHLVRVILELTRGIALPLFDTATDEETADADAQSALDSLAPEHDGLTQWASQHGVELEAALQRLGGDLHLYERMARELHKSLTSAEQEFAQAFATEDLALLMRHLHTFKGICNTLGLVGHAQSFAAMEARCKSFTDAGEVQPLQEPVGRILEAARATANALCEALVQQMPLQDDAARLETARPVDIPETMAALSAMLQLIGASDLAVLQSFAAARLSLHAVSPELTSQLEDALQGLDMTRADGLCRELARIAENLGNKGQSLG